MQVENKSSNDTSGQFTAKWLSKIEAPTFLPKTTSGKNFVGDLFS